MAESPKEDPTEMPLNERLLDLLVYVPAGIAASVVEDFPAMAERGRAKLGVRVSSARAIGMFAVKAGSDEFLRRSAALRHRGGGPTPGGAGTDRSDHPDAERSPDDRESPDDSPTDLESGVAAASNPDVAASPPPTGTVGVAAPSAAPPPPTPPGNAHVPPVSTLSIPGFDTLSASQVVQRLDGLNRSELVAVRAYEASTRGRRTILSRVDQLLDERS